MRNVFVLNYMGNTIFILAKVVLSGMVAFYLVSLEPL
jgi:hypothetical protein